MKIGIAARWLTYHDGVSYDVFGMYEALKNAGYDAYLFCETRHWRTLHKPIKNIQNAPNILNKKDDILIYHYTSGWDKGIKLLRNLQCQKLVRYHGITPPDFFKDISLSHEKRTRDGYRLLKQLNNIDIDLFIPNSKHSTNELLRAGVELKKSCVVPPVYPIEKLLCTRPKKRLYQKLKNTKNILSVGRIAPHKGHLNLLKGFAHYHTEYNKNSRLIICGKQNKNLKQYTHLLKQTINELNMNAHVMLINEGSLKTVKTLYSSADAYVAISDHEGFCIPIVEAMAHRVPVVGKNSTAIPETMNSSGLLWDSQDTKELGELIHKAEAESTLRQDLQERGWNSYEKLYSFERTKEQFCLTIKNLTCSDSNQQK